jgi:hypothetical protein
VIELPTPPHAVLDGWEPPLFVRSPEMEDFLRDHWIDGGTFPAEPFLHLQDAKVGVLWANHRARTPNSDNRYTVGLAEIYEPKPAKKWIMLRQTWAMHVLFGMELPDFVVTFDAAWWAAETVTVATKLSAATHELLHCGQARDRYGEPKVARTGPRKGQPVWAIIPHDVERFNLEVEWFGADAAGVTDMVAAASREPLMLGKVGAFSCGSCGKAA